MILNNIFTLNCSNCFYLISDPNYCCARARIRARTLTRNYLTLSKSCPSSIFYEMITLLLCSDLFLWFGLSLYFLDSWWLPVTTDLSHRISDKTLNSLIAHFTGLENVWVIFCFFNFWCHFQTTMRIVNFLWKICVYFLPVKFCV